MTEEEFVKYWIEKAEQDLGLAIDNLKAGRLQNAVRDAYFACFHAFSAILLKEGRSFRKHKEVRSALHRDYIKTKRIAIEWGKHYDWLFDNRQKADYRPLVQFEVEQVEYIINKSQNFVGEMKKLIE
ncbi:MAG: HEPN domain-containing protein [Deltaproteobacteria bacterium]|nr:HEPN domain-containing protein [Deltaproteobacteria bacterium]MBW1928907.1 HEPN domain-containing protein [Deltaproteobacteria bacterium]MBW2026195.1 HEPN domain-containing protein [Deltaproteobacteria bacterium]MBW2125897.1 HEPN domain-containing protein [Deltaproteobacteria bacterium]RLB19645.1 MAG: hypothetical protein DRG63_00555 [Deltaproteobacteria bacterium]